MRYMAHEQWRSRFQRKVDNLDQARGIAGVTPPHVYEEGNLAFPRHLEQHAQFSVRHGSGHVVQEQADAQAPLVQPLVEQNAHLLDLFRGSGLDPGIAIRLCHLSAIEKIGLVDALHDLDPNGEMAH